VLHLFLIKPVSQFRSVEDVKNCRIDATNFCLPAGGASENFWREAIEPSRSNCRKLSLEDDQPVLIKGSDPFSQGLDALTQKETCDFFLGPTGTLTVAAEGRYCNRAEVVGEPFYPHSASFILPKGSNYTLSMSDATLRLQLQDRVPSPFEYGVVQECNKVSQTQLTWEILKIFFYAAYAALAFALLLNVIRIWRALKTRQDLRENDIDRAGSSNAMADS
jgi:hypothetical protein